MIFSRDLFIVIAFALLIASAVGGFNYWRKYQEHKLDEVARTVYLYEKGVLSRQEAAEKIKNSPYMLYFLILTGENFREIVEHVKDPELRKFFLERTAYELYRDGKHREALEKLEGITREDFNYPSALLLKAVIYESLGESETARELYGKLSASYRDSYFGRVAYARLLSLESP